MYFGNGTVKSFVINTDKNTFKMKKKTYYLYYEESWYDLSLRQYHLFYHEDFAVPINREIMQQGDEAFYNVKPENLQSLISFEYVKVLAGSHSFSKALRTIIIIGIVNAVLVAINLLFTYSAGKT